MVKLPSPFAEIPRLIYRWGCELMDSPRGPQVAVRNSGLAFAGNKVRKLEYVLADAVARGADTLVTTGSLQSNHMCQTSAAAARLGLKVALYPANRVASDDAEYKYLGNIQANSILGAETFAPDTSEETVIQILKGRGQKPYSIPAGASTHPLGGLGYARWVFELLEQEAKLGVTFDVIALVAGSCSTLGGILAGLKLAQKEGIRGSKKHLVGFSVLYPKKEDVVEKVLSIAKNAASKIGVSPDEITEDDFEIDASYIGEGYGQVNGSTADGMKELARMEGILTDPVYTGKAFNGLLHTAKSGALKGKNVLFIHTGGQAVLGAYPQLR
ncbi:hypothetical protein H9Q74_008887 [Fusarium xylarioides]|nr:hypothetical protein H9Q71_009266 [Fusarium xylarioides]KAG5820446.1 hypothetical protein H9Q74_008887 [Fusarium xylarioides]